ncbi:hypothetical protein [Marispirochaeta aestuarii]|nr:hypothetical protein [Marispirochaeta aestuarii]
MKIRLNFAKLSDEIGISLRRMSIISDIHWTDFRRFVKTGRIPLQLAIKLEAALFLNAKRNSSEQHKIMIGRDRSVRIKAPDFPDDRNKLDPSQEGISELSLAFHRLTLRLYRDYDLEQKCNCTTILDDLESASEYTRLKARVLLSKVTVKSLP